MHWTYTMKNSLSSFAIGVTTLNSHRWAYDALLPN